jgi:predicted membrane GTPase involved in stress response
MAAAGCYLEIQRVPLVDTFVLRARNEAELNSFLARLPVEFNVTAAAGKPRVEYKRFSACSDSGTAAIVHEPIMRVEVRAPEGYAPDVLSNLIERRGQARWHFGPGGQHVVRGTAPLAALLGYADDLAARTRGRATCTIQFDHFRPVDRDDDVIGAPAPARVVPPLPRRASGIELEEPDDEHPIARGPARDC